MAERRIEKPTGVSVPVDSEKKPTGPEVRANNAALLRPDTEIGQAIRGETYDRAGRRISSKVTFGSRW